MTAPPSAAMRRRCTRWRRATCSSSSWRRRRRTATTGPGESVYRQWVYDHYLTVPQDTYDALTAQFSPGQGWNTTQAKTAISRFLAANLTLREGTVTPATGDVAAWLLTAPDRGTVSTMLR